MKFRRLMGVALRSQSAPRGIDGTCRRADRAGHGGPDCLRVMLFLLLGLQ